LFFFEKKNQKTFATYGRSLTQAAVQDSAPKEQKFFGSFFQKRTASFPCGDPAALKPALADSLACHISHRAA